MSGPPGDAIDVSDGTSFTELKEGYTNVSGNTHTGTPGPISISDFAGKSFWSAGPAVPAASAGKNINIKGFQYWNYLESGISWGSPGNESTSGRRTFNPGQGEIPPGSDSGSEG